MEHRVHEYRPKEEANKNLFLRFPTVHSSSEITSSQGHTDQNSLTENEERVFFLNVVFRNWKIKEKHKYPYQNTS